MAFRRSKSDTQRQSRAWQAWIDRHRSELAAIGLPAEVFLDEARWSDFMENGHLHWHQSSGFEFGRLAAGQMTALNRFLEREYEGAECTPPLLAYVRVRLGN